MTSLTRTTTVSKTKAAHSENIVRSTARDRDARTRIVDAAEKLFRRDGFRRTSMDAIAEGARTSKRTLYTCFSDKHAVLESVLVDFSVRGFEAIAKLSVGVESASTRTQLISLARELRQAALNEHSLGMYRVLIAEAEYLPSLSKKTHRQGVEQVAELVRDPLKKVGIDDSVMVARIFYDLLVLAPVQRRLVGAADDLIDVEQIVDLILKGMPRK